MECVVWSPGVSLDALERQVVTAAYSHFRQNKTATAQSLGVAVRTLEYKLESYAAFDAEELERKEAVKREREAFQRRQRGLEVSTDLPGCKVTPGGHILYTGNGAAAPTGDMPQTGAERRAELAAAEEKAANAMKAASLVGIEKPAPTDAGAAATAAGIAAKLAGMAPATPIDLDGNPAPGDVGAPDAEEGIEDLLGGKPTPPTPIAPQSMPPPPRNAGNPYGNQRHASHGKRR